jgi:hypothetical protein
MLHKLTPPFLATWLHDKSEKTQSPGPFFLTGTKVEINQAYSPPAGGAPAILPHGLSQGQDARDW